MSDNNLFFFNTIICSMSRRVYVQWFVPYQVSNYTIIKKLKKKKKKKKWKDLTHQLGKSQAIPPHQNNTGKWLK